MNKTVNINLSGIIFHIEEEAYGKLYNYLSTIKGYFSESEGRDEIMADIENRIAEMLSERITDKKQVVIMTDVAHVIEVMGKPEEFVETAPEGEKTQNEQTTYRTTNKKRRVFRDSDNKILGGVCSGIANYFNIDPLWLRLALVVSFFALGTGFLLYIVLWIVIPEAKTSAEKLEMRGEDVNFSNIGKKVEEEMNSFGKRAGKWGEEVKNSASETSSKARDFIDQLLHFIGAILGGFFRVFIKIVGVFFVIIGLVFLVAMASSMFGETGIIHLDGDTYSIQDGYHMFFNNESQNLLASITLLLVVGVPLIMLIYGGIKMLLGIRKSTKYVGLSAFILWIIGIVLALILGNQVAAEFSDEATSKTVVELQQPKSGTLYLDVKDYKDEQYGQSRKKGHFRFRAKKHNLITVDDENINFGFPDLNIVRGESENFELVIFSESKGSGRKEALELAKKISYEINQKDSLVELNSFYSVVKTEKWRGQSVHVELRVPKGKSVFIGRSMKNILYDVNNESDTWDGDMVNRLWIMGDNELRCVDCDGLDKPKKKKGKKDLESRIEKEINEALEEKTDQVKKKIVTETTISVQDVDSKK